MAHRPPNFGEKLGRLHFFRVGAGRFLVGVVAAAAAAGHARQPGLHRPLFGPDTLAAIEKQLISTAGSFFSTNIVTEIIAPTVSDIVQGARGEVVSLGFVISLWAGSSAISAFVDSVVEAHDQTPLRHPVRQRFFALGLYMVMLVFVIAAAPIVALGPRKISEYIPDSWDNVLRYGYFPLLVLGLVLAVTILYRVSLPGRCPPIG